MDYVMNCRQLIKSFLFKYEKNVFIIVINWEYMLYIYRYCCVNYNKNVDF